MKPSTERNGYLWGAFFLAMGLAFTFSNPFWPNWHVVPLAYLEEIKQIFMRGAFGSASAGAMGLFMGGVIAVAFLGAAIILAIKTHRERKQTFGHNVKGDEDELNNFLFNSGEDVRISFRGQEREITLAFSSPYVFFKFINSQRSNKEGPMALDQSSSLQTLLKLESNLNCLQSGSMTISNGTITHKIIFGSGIQKPFLLREALDGLFPTSKNEKYSCPASNLILTLEFAHPQDQARFQKDKEDNEFSSYPLKGRVVIDAERCDEVQEKEVLYSLAVTKGYVFDFSQIVFKKIYPVFFHNQFSSPEVADSNVPSGTSPLVSAPPLLLSGETGLGTTGGPEADAESLSKTMDSPQGGSTAVVPAGDQIPVPTPLPPLKF